MRRRLPAPSRPLRNLAPSALFDELAKYSLPAVTSPLTHPLAAMAFKLRLLAGQSQQEFLLKLLILALVYILGAPRC